MVHDANGHNGGAVVLVEDDMQAVRQIKLDVFDLRRLGPKHAGQRRKEHRIGEG